MKVRKILNLLAEHEGVDHKTLTPYVEANIMGGVADGDFAGCIFKPDDSTHNLEAFFQQEADRYRLTNLDSGFIRVDFLGMDRSVST